ncbi:MAG: sulfurtransferase-like selenium metabolism protein YedF [Thermodesulfobacteriota bacterium]
MSEKKQSNPIGEACGAVPEGQAQAGKKIAVLLATDSLGKPDEALGQHIVVNFIMKMKEMKDDLWRLILLNGAVKHTVAGSEGLPHLQELAQNGLNIMVCGPCLKAFGLYEKNQVGEVTNMLDIITSMQLADKVISLT